MSPIQPSPSPVRVQLYRARGDPMARQETPHLATFSVPCRTREGEDDELRSATFQFALRVRGGLMMPDVVAGLEYALETIC